MKKHLQIISIFLIVLSCGTINSTDKTDKGERKSPENELVVEEYKTSLIEQGIDTMTTITYGCVGCSNKSLKKSYVIWVDSGVCYSREFYSSNENTKVLNQNIFNYYFLNRSKIENSILFEPNYILSHYNYVELSVSIKNSNILTSKIENKHRILKNIENPLFIWLLTIESNLFQSFHG